MHGQDPELKKFVAGSRIIYSGSTTLQVFFKDESSTRISTIQYQNFVFHLASAAMRWERRAKSSCSCRVTPNVAASRSAVVTRGGRRSDHYQPYSTILIQNQLCGSKNHIFGSQFEQFHTATFTIKKKVKNSSLKQIFSLMTCEESSELRR